MPSGAKKRKASKKKKKEQEAIGASQSNKGFDGHGNDEHGSLSSPDSQGYGELCTRDPPPSPLSSLGKDSVKDKTEDADVPQGQEVKGVDEQPNSFPENVTLNAIIAASKEAVDSLVSKV